jgi:transposase
MPRALSVDLRERSLHALASGMSVTEVATRFDVSRSSLYRWQRQRSKTGSVTPAQSPGRPRRLDPDHEAALRAEVQTHPDATLAELCRATPVALSPTTMGRTLRRLGLARKKRV